MISAQGDFGDRADLRARRCRLRARRGRWLDLDDRRALSRFRRRHRGDLARPCPSASRRGADAARARSSGTFRTCTRIPRASASPAASPTRPSPTSSSSPIRAPRPTRRRSRWRAGASTIDGHPERYRILTFEGAFHGRTLATIAAGGRRNISKALAPRSTASTRSRSTDLAAVEAAIGPETAAILIEPIQGEGGVRVDPAAFLRGLREICDRHGLLLIFDEVQTGVGRTGRFFAYEHCGVHPDILTIRQGHRRRLSDVGLPCDRGRGARPDRRRARHDLRRQSARHGDRQRGARRRPRAGLPRACRPGSASICASASPSSRTAIRDVIEEMRGEGLMLGAQAQGPAGRFRRGGARREAARHSGRRQCRAAAAAARRHRRGDRRGREAARRRLRRGREAPDARR